MIFIFVYVMFLIWIQICRKLYFTDLANPKNPNLNLDSTDYGCEIRLLAQMLRLVGSGFKFCKQRLKYGRRKKRLLLFELSKSITQAACV